jgi:WXG100 family type VII secretion target
MVDDSPYRTDLDELRLLVDRAADIGDRLVAHLDRVEHNLAALEPRWSGAAASAHHDAQRQWLRDARDMHAVLDRLRADTAAAHDRYRGVVDHHRRMWPDA